VGAMSQKVDKVIQALADAAIWLLFKGNRVRS
jgi:hypothetical protein